MPYTFDFADSIINSFNAARERKLAEDRQRALEAVQQQQLKLQRDQLAEAIRANRAGEEADQRRDTLEHNRFVDSLVPDPSFRLVDLTQGRSPIGISGPQMKTTAGKITPQAAQVLQAMREYNDLMANRVPVETDGKTIYLSPSEYLDNQRADAYLDVARTNAAATALNTRVQREEYERVKAAREAVEAIARAGTSAPQFASLPFSQRAEEPRGLTYRLGTAVEAGLNTVSNLLGVGDIIPEVSGATTGDLHQLDRYLVQRSLILQQHRHAPLEARQLTGPGRAQQELAELGQAARSIEGLGLSKEQREKYLRQMVAMSRYWLQFVPDNATGEKLEAVFSQAMEDGDYATALKALQTKPQ